MERYYSKIDEEQLIFCLLRKDEICERRMDLSPDSEFMQVCGREMNKGTFVPPHRHIETIRNTNLTQESWVVLEGKVKAKFYDLDDSFLCDREISSGDVVVLYRGGHSMTVLEDNTIFYEFKNGPYFGVNKDKEKISE
jgi:cupin fold WbuC family metalloprotein